MKKIFKAIFILIIVTFIIVSFLYLKNNKKDLTNSNANASDVMNNASKDVIVPSVNITEQPNETSNIEQTPSIDSTPKEIDVNFTVDKFENDGFPIFTIHSNLPDNTRILVTLNNESGYIQKQEGIITGQEFITDGFHNNGEALKAGNYKITIEMLNSQYDSVKAIIGENNEMLVGNYIENVNGKKIAKRSLNLKLYLEDAEVPIDTSDLPNIDEQTQMYLSISPFSYMSLVSQLESDGYSTSDATRAVDKCGANWQEQAHKRAIVYLDRNSEITKQQLLEQLKYEGFTDEEAEYGVEQVMGN